MNDSKPLYTKALSETEAIERMVLDILKDHPKGCSYEYLKSQITIYYLRIYHLQNMEIRGVIYRSIYQGKPIKRYKISKRIDL